MSDLSVHISKGCLVVPVQGDINDERMQLIQNEILESVEEKGLKGVVIDLSGVKLIDIYHADIINKTAKMINLLGAKTVLSGIRPGVAIALSDSHFEFDKVYNTARTFEDGVEILQSIIVPYEQEALEKEIVEVEDINTEENEKEDKMIVETKKEVEKEQSLKDEKFCED